MWKMFTSTQELMYVPTEWVGKSTRVYPRRAMRIDRVALISRSKASLIQDYALAKVICANKEERR